MIFTTRISRYTSVPVKPLPFDVVAAFLRLGLKYNIESLRDEATTRLTHEFPSSLDIYDRMVDGEMIELSDSFVNDTINLLRECQYLTHILPVAFYLQACEDPHPFYQPAISDHGKQVQLSPEDKSTLLEGWLKIVKAQREHTYAWLHQTTPVSVSCLSKSGCFTARATCVLEAFTPIPSVSGLNLFRDGPTDGVELCVHCETAAKIYHNEGREKLWQILPSFFGLPEWNELLKENVSDEIHAF